MLIVRGNSPVLGMDNHPVGLVPGVPGEPGADAKVNVCA
jgi:hypothetical protein